VRPSEERDLAAIRAELARLLRYDDESIVHDRWIRQRYDGGYAASYLPARTAAVVTAWHEAGHAVAALAIGARFSSASIYHGRDSAGRVHGIRGAGELAFAVDAAGQIAEHLRTWTMPERDEDLRAWLKGWTHDGGDARRFRQAIVPRFGPAGPEAGPGAGPRAGRGSGGGPAAGRAAGPGAGPAAGPVGGEAECAAWRYSERLLTPRRPAIRQLARALLVHPRPLPYPVASAIAGDA
jgi:hypothetical protein